MNPNDMKSPELILLARQTAIAHSLPPEIVLAMIDRESEWDEWAIRFEPGFLAKYVNKLYLAGKFSATEAYARSFSWGLLQIMGEDARENGFQGPMAQLCDPATGIEFGCREFARIFKATNGDVNVALERWNGGGNPNYAGEVVVLSIPYKSASA
jgi:hypothetical protein